MRWLAIASVLAYYHSAYRVRGWGPLPSAPGPKLLIANHQHEIEAAVIVSDLSIKARFWRYPIFTVSSRRMWEPGFFAERIPWLSPFLRSVNAGPLFGALGMQPIENELNARPFVSIAYALVQGHSDLDVTDVFSEPARKRLGAIRTLKDLLDPKYFAVGRERVKLTEINEPYRKEILEFTRAQIDADLAHFENLQRAGGSVFLTPEGFYSGDGKLQRFRGALSRLAPLSQHWLIGISYDPFVGRRLSMLYRVVQADRDVPLEQQIKRIRPVTTSALLGSWLSTDPSREFSADQAHLAVEDALLALPAELFVDPELRKQPAGMVDVALAGLERMHIIARHGERYRLAETRRHPQFPRTADIIEYQFNFHRETLEGAGRSA